MVDKTKGKLAEERAALEKPSTGLKGSDRTGSTEPRSDNRQNAESHGSSDDRRRNIAEAAYYRAERRGFAPGYEDGDWLEAEKELNSAQDSVSRNREVGMNIDDLNKCLRSELSAIETYQQALEKNRSQYGQDTKFQQLSKMLDDHREAASQLRTLIEQKGGKPSGDSGAWGTWSKTIMGAAKLIGDKAALKALKEGEESGMKEYQSIAQDSAAPADVKTVTSPLLAKQQEHIRELDRLIEAA
jgi:hypothetical protein